MPVPRAGPSRAGFFLASEPPWARVLPPSVLTLALPLQAFDVLLQHVVQDGVLSPAVEIEREDPWLRPPLDGQQPVREGVVQGCAVGLENAQEPGLVEAPVQRARCL